MTFGWICEKIKGSKIALERHPLDPDTDGLDLETLCLPQQSRITDLFCPKMLSGAIIAAKAATGTAPCGFISSNYTGNTAMFKAVYGGESLKVEPAASQYYPVTKGRRFLS